MRTSLAFATSEFLPIVALAQRAEALGYYRVWTTETPARDGPVRALTLALRTQTIQVATGIAYAFTRAPLAMAATAADVNMASGGRFSLGLGAGTRGMRSRWYGIDEFDAPATRLAEYAALLRTAWAADREFAFDGRFYRGSYGQIDGVREAPPIWGAGLNATMLTVAARHFDGVAVHALAAVPSYLDAVALPAIDTGRAESSRSLQVAAWRLASVDEDGEAARRRGRAALAFYFSTPSYRSVAEVAGWAGVAAKIGNALLEKGPQWAEIGEDLIPEEMLQEFCVAGRPTEVRAACERLTGEYERRGIDELVLQTAPTDSEGPAAVAAMAKLIETLAPA